MTCYYKPDQKHCQGEEGWVSPINLTKWVADIFRRVPLPRSSPYPDWFEPHSQKFLPICRVCAELRNLLFGEGTTSLQFPSPFDQTRFLRITNHRQVLCRLYLASSPLQDTITSKIVTLSPGHIFNSLRFTLFLYEAKLLKYPFFSWLQRHCIYTPDTPFILKLL